jgi:hypothetical protein
MNLFEVFILLKGTNMKNLVPCLFVYFLGSLTLGLGCGSSPADPDTTAPNPSTLSSTVDFSLVQLSWNQCSSDDFAEYRLYRSTTSGISQSPGTPLATFTSVADLSYNDASVEQNETYYYALETVDTSDLSAWSNEVISETPVEAVAGYWGGTTEQGKVISFYVTTDLTVGELTVTLDISGAPDITVTYTDYIAYDIDGTWVMSGEYEYGGATHTIGVQGTFTSSNLCEGNLIASSETYYGGYYIDATFSTYPQ